MPEQEVVRMTTAGWVFLGISWVGITWLLWFCVRRMLKSAKHREIGETPLDGGFEE